MHSNSKLAELSVRHIARLLNVGRSRAATLKNKYPHKTVSEVLLGVSPSGTISETKNSGETGRLTQKEETIKIKDLSERGLARELGIGRTRARTLKRNHPNETLDSIISKIEDVNLNADVISITETPVVISEGNDEFYNLATEFNLPPGSINSRTLSRWNPRDGKAERVSYNPRLATIIESQDTAEEMYGVIENFSYATPKSQRTGVASVLNLADLQIGKACQRGGGTQSTIEKVLTSVNLYLEHLRQTKPDAVVIADNGDIIENFFNTSSQAQTNDLSLTDQIRTARRLILEVIKQVAPLAPELYYVAVPSNHGQVRSGLQSPMATTDDDFGLEIFEQLKDIAENSDKFPNLNFVRPAQYEETAVIDVAGTRIAFNHGHTSGGSLKHGDWWRKQDHGRRPGWDADILVMGHYHNHACYQSGDGRWVVSCASSDPGSDWFANKSGETALRGVTSFDVKDGTFTTFPRLV